MAHLGFGFQAMTRQAEDLQIASLVGAPIHAGDNVVEGKDLRGSAVHAHLWQCGPNQFALTAFEAAVH